MKGKLVRNFTWNVAGTILPMVAALFSVPVLIRELGAARFGVLTLAWMVVGYFGLFDMGIGRAMTQLVAERLGRSDHKGIPPLVWTGIQMMLALGLLGGALMAAGTPWLVGRVLSIPSELQPETVRSFYLLSVSIPVVILTAGLRGILEAYQQFGLVNLVKIPSGIFNYVAPLLVLLYTTSLAPVVLALVVARFLSAVAYAVICLRWHPTLRIPRGVDRAARRRLLSYGGWITLSNVAAPVLLYLGRFFLAAMVSAEAVAYFSTPYDIVTNMLLVPGIFVSVLVPVFVGLFHSRFEEVPRLYHRSLLQVGMILMPMAAVVVFFARPGISLWIDPSFAESSYRTAQVLALGMLINSFGHISQALVQSYGRPDLTAKLHVVELLVYVPYLWLFIHNWGIQGAAWAWVLRVSISTMVLAILANRCLSSDILNRAESGR